MTDRNFKRNFTAAPPAPPRWSDSGRPALQGNRPVSDATVLSRGVFLEYIHRFRGIAILLVVVSHVKLFFVWPDPSPASVRLLMSLIEGGTVPFLFIAGFLFQHLSRRFDYWGYLRTKANFVLFPYLLWSLPVLIHSYIHSYGIYLGRAVAGIRHGGTRSGHRTAHVHSILVHPHHSHHLSPGSGVPGHRSTAQTVLVAASAAAGRVAHASIDALSQRLAGYGQHDPGIPLGHGCQSVPRARPGRHRQVLASVADRRDRAGCGRRAVVEDVLSGQGGRVQSALPFSTEHGMVDFTYLQKILLSLWVLQLLARREASAPASTSFWWRAADRLADLSFGMFFLHMYVKGYLLDPLARRFYHLPLTDWLQFLAVSAVLFLVTLLVVSLAKCAAGKYSRYLIGC